MREIKFRGWDKEKKEMVYVLDMMFLFEDIKGIWVSGYDSINIDHEIFPENLELMQYTGMKDRHGREIYEGDIVKIPAGYGGDRFYKECIAVIEYEEHGFYPRNIHDEFDHDEFGILYQDGFYHWKLFEVIGNIYENKDLLP